jgi:DNA-binding NtrC family response regulator
MPNKARVFVVDDEQIIADTFAMILNQSGFDAVPLYNGPDAIALCRRKPCDVLLTDVMMNPMNGVDTALAIRQICPTCKVLLFSGNPDTATRVERTVVAEVKMEEARNKKSLF